MTIYIQDFKTKSVVEIKYIVLANIGVLSFIQVDHQVRRIELASWS